ncbi:LOW QUALITY PROTEIN: uncharacterized protein KIAA0232 homolog [Orycteropus afer afer]|uniref:LOW QUALITY PROTEIN: uncharacterized protein KIAA0232 homolog n=1 Tax=Orycteropus afer afer TaxID=1230840 RepID=A0A8B7B467_ORYAF|nr:LOW QUALITY PROTEIN: uncharacterized protein KIAA0232 homolog [Orycteropus afer afer]
MRPLLTTGVDGLPPGSASTSHPGPGSVSAMPLLHALGPVQTWLGQELEKCGIDAMIYTRYVLSLLLHDSCDYDLQEQENDIFLGWEKGAYKKWGRSKKKGADLTLEEMKKQAAVQCLRSASDESSGIESLVEELCCRLKDLQSEQEEKIHKKLEDSSSPEAELSPTAKDQVEMYYEAFPPLSEKPVCLQEIMTVWNKSKVCSYSSSSCPSSTAPAGTATPSPKDGHSESEATREGGRAVPSSTRETAPGRSGSEKETTLSNSAPEEPPAPHKKPARHRPEGKARPRSWSSGSSEAGSSSSGPQGEPRVPAKCVKVRHKPREARVRKGRDGQGRLPARGGERADRSVRTGSSSSGGGGGSGKQLCKRGRRPLKELGLRDAGGPEGRAPCVESRDDREYKEEPLWYTEPIAEYFVPSSRKSKLETTYRHPPEPSTRTPEADEELVDAVRGLCVSSSAHKTYLAAGTFVGGHFVEMPAVISEAADLPGTAFCSPPEDTNYPDDIHLSEFTHFYEVDIDQSMLDPGASESMQGESRILNLIRQKGGEGPGFEAGCCIVLDGVQVQGQRAIWTEPTGAGGAEGLLLQGGAEDLAQFWDCCSSSSGDADAESFAGDSPARLSPLLDGTMLSSHAAAGSQELLPDAPEGPAVDACLSVFEVQCSDSGLPFSFETLNLGNADADCSADGLGKTQSRLLIWTKNRAFEENGHCSNLSTRTCSPWSHSEETRSDTETLGIQSEESTQFHADDINYGVPRVPSNYGEEELLDFLQDEACQHNGRTLGESPTFVFKKQSKLESVCGIQLEHRSDSGGFESVRGGGYRPGVGGGIWTHVAGGTPVATVDTQRMDGEAFSADTNDYCCCLDAGLGAEGLREPSRAVQRSEYRLWEGQKGGLPKHAFAPREPAEVDGSDYMTPSRPWDVAQGKESTFILGGVYGELQTFSEAEWAVVPPGPTRSSLLQCASSDVVTIAGTDVFMTPGNSFAPGHRQLWRPLVSFDQNELPRSGEGSWNKGFSFIFREDLLGACGTFQVEEPGLECPFSSLELSSPLSQVLHVECSLEPEGIASFSPSFKPKSILCSDSDSEVFHPRARGVERTQYRAIRISPRTHFRPIPASELSPGGSGSESESEKEEASLPTPAQVDTFQDPQADLKPLEEDAQNEGHYYGKSELESGRFLPRLKKSGMEKSAQTSLDSQEEAAGVLQVGKPGPCLECRANETVQRDLGSSQANCRIVAPCEEETNRFCSCKAGCQFPAYEDNVVPSGRPEEFPVLNTDVQGARRCHEKPTWWEKALFSPLFPASECEECYANAKGENGAGEYPEVKNVPSSECPLDFNRVSSVYEARCAGERLSGAQAHGFRRKVGSGTSSAREDTGSEDGGAGRSEGGGGWAGPGEEELFSGTHL